MNLLDIVNIGEELGVNWQNQMLFVIFDKGD